MFAGCIQRRWNLAATDAEATARLSNQETKRFESGTQELRKWISEIEGRAAAVAAKEELGQRLSFNAGKIKNAFPKFLFSLFSFLDSWLPD